LRLLLLALLAFLALAPDVADAQSNRRDRPIVITGNRTADGKPIPMSDWRVAETDHVLVYSKGDQSELVRVAHNLEKLHFLLSMLLNRVDEPDDAIKLKVTMIGDVADFNQLGLRNLRWQRGPYPKAFPTQLYYDPREDGAVLATTRTDQEILLQQGVSLASLNLNPSANKLVDVQVNEVGFPLKADGRLYAGFAQHYLMTYFPAAYPRWYLDGFGEIFATMVADAPGKIEYGHPPEGFRQVIEWYGRYPLRNVLNGRYLEKKRSHPDWTPYHAWALVHLLFFDAQWKQPLHNYLAAVARGSSESEAIAALGEVDKLQGQLFAYRGRKVPYEVLTYPPERVQPPIVRQLRRNEANFVRGRLELGARVTLPPEPSAGEDPEVAARMTRDRQDAIAERDAFLRRLRDNAARYPGELEVQLLLAEAECRSDNLAGCTAAAEQALAIAPQSSAALAWKGLALARQAAAGPQAERTAKLKIARSTIARANRSDPDAVLPLLAYYRSFAAAGERAPDIAVEGLIKVVESVPSAPTPRLMLGTELAARGERSWARRTLLPVAAGPYESPERPGAEAVLEQVSSN
jgi:hypothetical protein